MAGEITNESAGYTAPTKAVQDSILVDLAMLKAAFDTAMVKLNADAGVTDEDYASSSALELT